MAAVKKSQAEDKAVGPILVKAGMATVKVKGPVHVTHAGRIYRQGESVELPDEVAAQLVALGVVTKPPERKR